MTSAMEDCLPRHRITVEEYYHMARVGLLAPDARVELIEGEIIDMAPVGSLHAASVNALARMFNLAASDQTLVSIQAPVRLGPLSEPQPDLALLSFRADEYRDSHPIPSEVLLIVEVSDSTLRYDRGVKVPLYARHGIPKLWIIDLESGQLHLFRMPRGAEYTEISSSADPGIVAPILLPKMSVDLSSILRR